MRKIMALTVLAIIMASVGLGATSASAESVPITETIPTVITFLSGEITPFASPIVERVEFNITKTLCSVKVSLTNKYSGTIKAVVQKYSGGSWSDYLTICNESFSATYEVYKSKSCSLGSGTYRIHLELTANNTSYSSDSSSYIIS